MTMSKCDPSAIFFPSLFHFDRNTGTCVDNTDGLRLPYCSMNSAPAPPCYLTSPTFIGYIGNSSPYEDVPPNYIYDCDKWYFCYEQTTYDEGVCPCGQEFDSKNNPCRISATPLDYCEPHSYVGGSCPVN